MRKRVLIFTMAVSICALLAFAGQERGRLTTAHRATARVTAAGATGWTTPVNISNTGAESRAPVVDLDAQGNAYVIWQDWSVFYGAGGPRQTMFNMNRTGSWQSAATLIHNQQYIAIDDSGFPTVVVNPAGTRVFVAYHDGDFSVGLMQVFYREWVNGAWGPDFQNLSQAPVPCEYPAIAFSPLDSSLFALFMADVNVPFELAMRFRDGATNNWSSTDLTNILNGASKYLYLTKQMKFDPSGVLHTVFTTHTQAWYSKNATPKNLNSWGSTINLSGETGLRDTDPRLAVDNAGEAYAVWQHLVGGNQEIMFRKTVNGVWQGAENLSQTTNDSELPAIAVNRLTGDLFVAWQEDLPGNAEVYVKSYDAKAKTWSANVNFSNSPGGSGEPYLNSDVNGGIHLVYVDTPAGGGKPEIYYSARQSGPKPPVNITLTTSLDSTETYEVNTLTWAANPDNTNYTISNFKVYRSIAGADFTVLATLSSSTLTYQDSSSLDPTKIYAYRLTSVANDGREGQPSAVYDDNQDFQMPPTKVTLTVGYDKILFSQQDNVKITFDRNPLNYKRTPTDKDANVAGYEIYRRKVGDSDANFALLTSLNATTFTYSYVIKPPEPVAQKYAYAMKTVFKTGAKSGLGTIVTEK